MPLHDVGPGKPLPTNTTFMCLGSMIFSVSRKGRLEGKLLIAMLATEDGRRYRALLFGTGRGSLGS